MVAYLRPEDIKSFNLDTLKRLKQLVPDESQRHTLIGLALKLGDYNTRKGLPEHFFSGKKSTNSRIELATYISQQLQDISQQLSSNSPSDVIASLKETPLEDNVRESEISPTLNRLDLATLGRRVEVRFSNMNPARYETYKKTPSNHVLYQLFLIEAETIIRALGFEAKR